MIGYMYFVCWLKVMFVTFNEQCDFFNEILDSEFSVVFFGPVYNKESCKINWKKKSFLKKAKCLAVVLNNANNGC